MVKAGQRSSLHLGDGEVGKQSSNAHAPVKLNCHGMPRAAGILKPLLLR